MTVRRHTLSILLSGAALALALGGLASRQEPTIDGPADPDRQMAFPDEAREQIGALRLELALLREQIGLSGNRPSRPVQEVAVEAAAFDPPERRREEPSELPAPHVAEAERDARIRQLADALDAGGSDTRFAMDLEAEIRQRFDELEELRDASLDAAVCSPSLCRMHFEFPDLEARDEGMPLVVHMVPWDFDGVGYVDPDEPLGVVLYATREGHALPAL